MMEWIKEEQELRDGIDKRRTGIKGWSLQDTGLCRIQIPSSIPIPFSVQDTGP